MNVQKLKLEEKKFLQNYPGGFQHPDMLAMAKKHRMDQMIVLAREKFAEKNFDYAGSIVEMMNTVISRSSLVSMFEKPKFRDMISGLSVDEKNLLALSLKNLLHGRQDLGFEAMVEVLKSHKLAKWSLISLIPNYYAPDKEVFVKPTTVKGVIQTFELEGIIYKPEPTWEFYRQYREQILQMKRYVDASLSPSNAAFCGFLMMCIKK